MFLVGDRIELIAVLGIHKALTIDNSVYIKSGVIKPQFFEVAYIYIDMNFTSFIYNVCFRMMMVLL